MGLALVDAVRCRMVYKDTDGFEAGVRFYLGYAAGPPTAADCVTLAGDIVAAWQTHIAPVTTNEWNVSEVDVLDLSSLSGHSGQAGPSTSGTVGTDSVVSSVCMNVEFDIARRYRGGKPRVYWPGPPSAGLSDNSHWNSGTITSYNTATSAFFAELEALTITSFGTLTHVSIPFYKGYNKILISDGGKWRGPGFKYPPEPNPSPVFDVVEGYSAKAVVGSQKRRRTSTTP